MTAKLATAIGNSVQHNETHYSYTSNFHNLTFLYGCTADEKVNYLLTFKNLNPSQVIMNGSITGYRSYNTQGSRNQIQNGESSTIVPRWMP